MKMTFLVLALLLSVPCFSYSQIRYNPRRAYQFYILAGDNDDGSLPPGLNTDLPDTDLRPDESPDCYGLDISKDGYIAKGTTIPTGTARIDKTNSISSVTYHWFYNRLWRWTNSVLYHYAPNYDDVVVPHGLSEVHFLEDSNDIVTVVPFGGSFVGVIKSTGGYVLTDASDDSPAFGRGNIIQSLHATNASFVTELEGILFVCNEDGLFAHDGTKLYELTRLVRDSVSSFANKALILDYEKKWVIGGSSFVYNIETKKLHLWSGSNFRYTSRAFRAPDWAVYSPTLLYVTVKHADTSNGRLTYQIKFEEGEWSEEYTMLLPYQSEKYTVVYHNISDIISTASHKMQIRINDIVGQKYIKEIRLEGLDFPMDYYSE